VFIDSVSEGIEMKGELAMIATANEISQAVMQEANKQIENIKKEYDTKMCEMVDYANRLM